MTRNHANCDDCANDHLHFHYSCWPIQNPAGTSHVHRTYFGYRAPFSAIGCFCFTSEILRNEKERETNGKVWDKIRLLTLLLFSALLSNCIEKNQVKWVNDKIRVNKLLEYSCLKIFLWILPNWKEVPKSKSFVCNFGLIKKHRRLTETVQNTVIQW